MERLQKFVSSRGLLKSCRLHDQAPRSGQTEIGYTVPRDLAPGASLYVGTDALKSFAERMPEAIEHPFVLVSGDSDRALSPAAIGGQTIDKILASDKLVAWYAQNLDTAGDPRLRPLPVGLDYHSLWEGKSGWALAKLSPFMQEQSLIDTLIAAPRIEERYLEA